MHSNKIIFLDIDGPVIPGHLGDQLGNINVISAYRSEFDVAAIQRLNHLCESTGAQIVTNSMQNYIEWTDADLRADLIHWGLQSEYFHADWRTQFPAVDYSVNPNPRRGWGRWLAIQEWQSRNGEANWVCFDDRDFTDDPRLILIDFSQGIQDQDALRARSLLMLD